MLKIKPWCSTSSANEMLLAQTSERACCSGAAPCVSKTGVLLHKKKAMSYVRAESTPSQGFSNQHAEPPPPNTRPPARPLGWVLPGPASLPRLLKSASGCPSGTVSCLIHSTSSGQAFLRGGYVFNLKRYSLIFGCTGSSVLCEGFL